MGKLQGKKSSVRITHKSSVVRTAGINNRIQLPDPVAEHGNSDLDPIFDDDNNYQYTFKTLQDGLTDDEIYQAVLEDIAQSPVPTHRTRPNPQRNQSDRKIGDKIQFAAEDSVIWRDAQDRHHIIYGKYLTSPLPSVTYALLYHQKENASAAEENRIIVTVEPVQATPENPVRIFYYNRYDASEGRGRQFDDSTAIPMFYLKAPSGENTFTATVFQHCFYPEIDASNHPDTLDLIYWVNEQCEPEGGGTDIVDPEPPVDEIPPVTVFTGTNRTANVLEPETSSNEMDFVDGTRKVVFEGRKNKYKVPEGNNPGPNVTHRGGTPCKLDDPLHLVKKFPVGIIKENWNCVRKLMHCEATNMFVESDEDGLNSFFVFRDPYVVTTQDDGPVTPLINNKLYATEIPEGSKENFSTLVYNEDCKDGDLDDLFTVQHWLGDTNLQPQLMMRMFCPTDPRGIPITDLEHYAMLRDPFIFHGNHLNLKTSVFFSTAGVFQCGEGGITGPILFTLQQAPTCVECLSNIPGIKMTGPRTGVLRVTVGGE